eukprot:1010251_1
MAIIRRQPDNAVLKSLSIVPNIWSPLMDVNLISTVISHEIRAPIICINLNIHSSQTSMRISLVMDARFGLQSCPTDATTKVVMPHFALPGLGSDLVHPRLQTHTQIFITQTLSFMIYYLSFIYYIIILFIYYITLSNTCTALEAI